MFSTQLFELCVCVCVCVCTRATYTTIVTFKSVSSSFLVYLCSACFYVSEHSCFRLLFSVSSPLRAASPECWNVLLSFVSFNSPGQHSTGFLLTLGALLCRAGYSTQVLVFSLGAFGCGAHLLAAWRVGS